MENTTIKIKGMSCNHCVHSVTKALKGITGVKEVNVSLDKGEAKIAYEPEKTSVDQFKSAIEEEGYSVV